MIVSGKNNFNAISVMFFICKAQPVILILLTHQRKLRFGMKVVSGFIDFIYRQSVR